MDTLTPPVGGSSMRSAHEHRFVTTQVSLIHAWPSRSFRPQPPHGPCRRFLTLPLSATASGIPGRASPLHSRLAADSRPNRVRHPRTDRSPPVAPHPASRRRSYIRLQAGERLPEEDSHLSDQTRFQAHSAATSRRTPKSNPENLPAIPLNRPCFES